MVRTPRNYDALRNEHANATGQSNSRQDQAPPPSQADAKSARSQQAPRQVGEAPEVWDGKGDLVSENAAATRMANRRNAQAMERHAAGQQHGADRNASPQAAAKENGSGKARLAEDLKAAKEGGNEGDPSHDPGRSR